MKEFLIKNFVPLIALILLALLYLQRCSTPSPKVEQIIHRDTTINTYIYNYDTTYITKPIIREVVKYKEPEASSTNDYTDDSVCKEATLLREQLYSTTMYSDTLLVDTIGEAYLQESIKGNKIAERKIHYSLRIPSTTTIISEKIPQKLRNKWFIGGGIGGNNYSLINDVNVGMGVLNKKDQLYEVKGRIDFKGNKYLELNTYWKIHF